MSARPSQPEPYIRGCIFPGLSDTAYPRANPSDSEHLPTDVWQAAQIPAGVRLEFVGEVDAVRIFYKTTTANLGYRGEGAGCTFSMYRSGQKIAEQEAVLGEGVVQLPVYGEPSRPAIVYLPEGMRPIITGIEGIGGFIEPAPRQPRWLCYGDAVTQGWLASAPSLAWPAVTARKLGLDLFNLGYAGSSRTDTAAALSLANIPAEIVSLAIGANTWGRFPHTPALCAEEIRAILTLLRAGHPDAPIVVMSPLLRPDAEDTPNPLGATLTELRIAMEEAVRERMISGDVRLHLVEGSTVVSASDLADSRYPGDDGHIRIAAAVGKVISPLVGDLRSGAEAHWAAEVAAVLQLQSPTPQLPSTDFLRQVGTAIGPVSAAPLTAAPAPAAPAPAPASASATHVAQGEAAQFHGPIPSVGAVPVYGTPAGVVPVQPQPPQQPISQQVPDQVPAHAQAPVQAPVPVQPQAPVQSQAPAEYATPAGQQVVPHQQMAPSAGLPQSEVPEHSTLEPPTQIQDPGNQEYQYQLQPQAGGADPNWAAELAGTQMAADQRAKQQADAELAGAYSDSQYDSAS